MMDDDKLRAMTERQKSLYDMTKQLDDCGCWIWQGQVSNSGYGRLNVKGADNQVRMMSAQSVSYQQFVSDIPDGQLVKQSCGNRLCINPRHLALLTL